MSSTNLETGLTLVRFAFIKRSFSRCKSFNRSPNCSPFHNSLIWSFSKPAAIIIKKRQVPTHEDRSVPTDYDSSGAGQLELQKTRNLSQKSNAIAWCLP